MRKGLVFILLLFPALVVWPASAGDILLDMQKLRVMGRALYIAAHPDDENTAVLSYLASELKVRTGYLSLTRGSGGQNLIGDEKGELLGIIRTQELLEARRIDGAQQFFTRAVDFGYSKQPEETLEHWNKDSVLADIVWAIRSFRPDVVITRFPPGGYGGHGHHTVSAQLAVQAFHAAADSAQYPWQLNHLDLWQPKRLYWNAWQWGDRRNAPVEGMLAINTGTYNPLIGTTFTKIAAQSRSMHKSQGFGAGASLGDRMEYFELLEGPPALESLFEGIDLTWERLPGGSRIMSLIDRMITEFDAMAPNKSIPLLLEIKRHLYSQKNSPEVTRKIQDVENLIWDCAGLELQAFANHSQYSPGDTVAFTFRAIHRSTEPWEFTGLSLAIDNLTLMINKPLAPHKVVETDGTFRIPDDVEYSQPFWLARPPRNNLYQIPDPGKRNLAELPPELQVSARFKVGINEIEFAIPLQHRQVDPVEGEVITDVRIEPPVTLESDETLMLFAENKSRNLAIRAEFPKDLQGRITFHTPKGWRVMPETIDLTGKPRDVMLTIFPPPFPDRGVLFASLEPDQSIRTRHSIDYAHIPQTTYFPRFEITLLNLDIRLAGTRVAYVMGSGDDIPALLNQLGYRVDLLTARELETKDLSPYDAIITGVRAYNTRASLANIQSRLFDYVYNGGNMVVQYNTSHRLVTDQLAPKPLSLSRTRVTDESATMHMLLPDHPVLSLPNTIDEKDFDNWVQERGLYFPGTWDPQFQAPLGCHDEGESLHKGSLLYLEYGKGVFIYTGLSFFRQLPAGVPGAFRLFANLIAGGRHE